MWGYHKALLRVTRVTMIKSKPLNLVQTVRSCLGRTGRMGIPVSICTLMVKPDLSLSETNSTKTVAQSTFSFRQEGFT